MTHSHNPKSVLAEAKRYASRTNLSPRHTASLEQALQSPNAVTTIQWCFSESPECLLVLTQNGEMFRYVGLYNWKEVQIRGDLLFGTAPDGTIRAMEIGSTSYLGLHPSANAASLAQRLGANKNSALDDICARTENSDWMIEGGRDSAPTLPNVTESERGAPSTAPTNPSVHISSVEVQRTMAEQDVSRLEERLRTLIDLHNKGLIADEDLARRREEILREI